MSSLNNVKLGQFNEGRKCKGVSQHPLCLGRERVIVSCNQTGAGTEILSSWLFRRIWTQMCHHLKKEQPMSHDQTKQYHYNMSNIFIFHPISHYLGPMFPFVDSCRLPPSTFQFDSLQAFFFLFDWVKVFLTW